MTKSSISYLQVEPTTRCNFTCKFCCGRKMEQTDIDVAVFRKLIVGIENLKHLQLQGEGEPLMHPQYFDMVELVKKHHPNAKVSITTNGTLLDTHIIQQIIDTGIFSVLVSIETPDQDKFKYIRGGDLKRIKSNLKNFVTIKKAKGVKHPLLGFAVTIMNNTFDEFKSIVALFKELGLDGEFTIQYLQNMKVYTAAYDDEIRALIPSLEKINNFQKLLAEDTELSKFISEHSNIGGFFEELYSSKKGGELQCPWLNEGLYCSSQGMASGCSYIKSSEKAFGYLQKSSIDEIILNRKKVAEKLSSGSIPTCCIDCNEIIINRK